MEWGVETAWGKPLFLNGKEVGWVCTTLNRKWTYTLARHKTDGRNKFKTPLEAELELMRVFGE